MVEPLVLFQVMFDKIANGGLPVNRTKPTNPTKKSEIPTQTVLSRKAARQVSKEKEITNKSMSSPPYRPNRLDSASTSSTLPDRSNSTERNISAKNCRVITNVPNGMKN